MAGTAPVERIRPSTLSSKRHGPNPIQVGHVVGLLVEARDCAADLGKDVWEFALEARGLRETGTTNTVLRWLLDMGYAAHAAEIPHPTECRRMFCPITNLSIPEDACFVLTPAGVDFARRLSASDPPAIAAPRTTPVWDAVRRELRVREEVVKRYRQPAEAQEMVLCAFEEENWPDRIDDPLPPVPAIDAKRRLHATIVNLNRFQKRRLIHFEGGGDGESIGWRIV